MPDKTWKAIERKVGEMLGLPKGSQRVGARGDSSFDVVAPILFDGRELGVEVKYRKEMPSYLFEWMDQAQEHRLMVKSYGCFASLPDAILVLVGYRRKKREYLAVLPLEEYVRLRRAVDGVPPAL